MFPLILPLQGRPPQTWTATKAQEFQFSVFATGADIFIFLKPLDNINSFFAPILQIPLFLSNERSIFSILDAKAESPPYYLNPYFAQDSWLLDFKELFDGDHIEVPLPQT